MTWSTVGPQPLRLTPEHHAAVEDLLDACVEWDAGRLPFTEVMKLGGYRSPMYTRRAAIQTTPLDDPRRASLMRLFDTLVRLQGYTATRHGCFNAQDRRELEEARQRVEMWRGRDYGD